MPTRKRRALGDEAWAGFLRTHERLWRALEVRMAPIGLSLAEYDVMLALRDAGPDGLRMSDLAERRLMSTGGFTRLADRLERRGLIVRTRSVVDARSFTATMTDNGQALLRRARRQHGHDIDDLFLSRLTDEQVVQLVSIWSALALDEPSAVTERSPAGPDVDQGRSERR